MPESAYSRAVKTPGDELLEKLTSMRQRAENHLHGLSLLVEEYIREKQVEDALDTEDKRFTEEDWETSDGWLTTLAEGYTKDNGNYQTGLADISALVVSAAGPQSAPEPEPEPEPE